MQTIQKDGVTLAFEDINPGSSASMLFVHGWGCDHTALALQADFFGRSRRVLSVDLRGHDKSDAPHQDYTMATSADDLVWVYTELALIKPIVVGHNTGGNLALELAARHPQIPASSATHRFFAEGAATCSRLRTQESFDRIRCHLGRGWLPCTHRVYRRGGADGRSDSAPELYLLAGHRPAPGIRPLFSAVCARPNQRDAFHVQGNLLIAEGSRWRPLNRTLI